MLKPPAKAPVGTRLWVLVCAICSAAGWILSALHQLNATGYAVFFGLVAVLAWVFKPVGPGTGFSAGRCCHKLKRRFRRWLPASFLGLSVMALAGGLIYLPTNYDALAYRTPRVLNWLAEGRWHWIPTEFNRLNTRAMGFEWLATPLIAFTGTDRFLFLANMISLLLLPGLLFSLFTRLSISRRAAWHWMWLVPTGYCFLLQAGSIGNDLFGAVFAIAAVDFALRARESGNVRDVWFSILAAALLTGSKASNLPLLLPWAVALAPSLRLLTQRIALTAATLVLAAIASIGPLIAVNLKYSGDWTGLKAEKVEALEKGSFLNVANNTALLTIQNLAPPVFPLAGAWNEAVPRYMPAGLKERLQKSFEPGGARWLLGELQIEEAAGLGFGVSVLLLLSVLAGCRRPAGDARGINFAGSHALLIIACAYVALLAFMVKSGLTSAARLIAPYYALLIPAMLLLPGQADATRRGWWRGVATAVLGFAALLLVLSPGRPLWPANTLLAGAEKGNRLLQRAKAVYEVYQQRADAFATVRALLPTEAQIVGLVASDDPETSLWRPFGHRRIVQVTKQDTAQDLLRKKIDCIVVNPKKLEMFFDRTFEQWLAEMHGEVLHEVTLPLRVTQGPSQWYLVKLKNPNPA